MDKVLVGEIRISSLEEIRIMAREFLLKWKKYRIFAFYADMGTGKTTFIRSLCQELGVELDAINSPTFSIINEYISREGDSIYHFDCYRLETLLDALNIGAEDYLSTNNYCFIEWPEVLEPILPNNSIFVEMKSLSNTGRILYIYENQS